MRAGRSSSGPHSRPADRGPADRPGGCFRGVIRRLRLARPAVPASAARAIPQTARGLYRVAVRPPGRLVARLHGQRSALESLNLRLEHEREETARASVLEERARIARELHDIVAHSLSVMVIQAGAAEQLVVRDDGVREPLEAIRTT